VGLNFEVAMMGKEAVEFMVPCKSRLF